MSTYAGGAALALLRSLQPLLAGQHRTGPPLTDQCPCSLAGALIAWVQWVWLCLPLGKRLLPPEASMVGVGGRGTGGTALARPLGSIGTGGRRAEHLRSGDNSGEAVRPKAEVILPPRLPARPGPIHASLADRLADALVAPLHKVASLQLLLAGRAHQLTPV